MSVEVEDASVERFVVRFAPVGAQTVAFVLGAVPFARIARAVISTSGHILVAFDAMSGYYLKTFVSFGAIQLR